MKIQRAVVLAAGRGRRMRELTVDLPKPMIEVRGKPVLQHIVEGLRDAGLREFFLIVGYRGDAVFLNDEMELVDIREKSHPGEVESPWYNAGLYAFRPSILDFTSRLRPSPRGEYELTDAICDLAQSGKKVKALELAGDWADVRDPEILARLNQ